MELSDFMFGKGWNVTNKKENRELTDQQQNFLTALFGEAEGNPKKQERLQGMHKIHILK